MDLLPDLLDSYCRCLKGVLNLKYTDYKIKDDPIESIFGNISVGPQVDRYVR